MTSTELAHRQPAESADDVLREAHDANYRFPPGFRGFDATLHTVDETGVRTGPTPLHVAGPRQVEVDRDASPAWARSELASIVAHRWAMPYEDADGTWAKHVGTDDGHPHGVLVIIEDDPFDSAYRVVAGRTAEVHRTMKGQRFVITLGERLVTPDGRVLPAGFTVHNWDLEAARLVRADFFSDTYVEVDGVFLPAAREVTTGDDAGLTTRRLTISAHRVIA
ncbi:MAG: DUF3386 family protein [Jiangellaceae bacterium]